MHLRERKNNRQKLPPIWRSKKLEGGLLCLALPTARRGVGPGERAARAPAGPFWGVTHVSAERGNSDNVSVFAHRSTTWSTPYR